MAKKILIIENDKFLRELVAQKLSKYKFGVLKAIDGEEELKIIEEKKSI